ncbi:FUSC family protein [Rathayibacter soli]|uniref:FUSC family protein n=1 Tax=Rathayibacter soli TaxID=3144168 RepID=UPI0027E4FE4A|nr:FUSC family protein [Glaciibacter superstes]
MKTPALGWVGQLLRPKSAPIPWSLAVRMGIAIVTPVAVGMALNELGIGLLVSMGAMAASLSDQGGRYRSRVRRLSTVAIAGASGFAIGGLVLGRGPLGVAAVLVAGLICGLVSVLSNVASVASLQFLIYLIIASRVSFIGGEWWLPPLRYLLGGAWALLLSLVTGVGRVTMPECTAVAAVFRCLAALMETSGGEGVAQARQALTAAMNTAYDTVVTFRARAGGRDSRVRRLAALLNAATPIVEATMVLIRNRSLIPAELSASVRQVADHVLDGSAPRQSDGQRSEDAPTTTAIRSLVGSTAALAELERRVGVVFGILSGASPGEPALRSRPRLHDRMLSLRDAVTGGATTWLPILRLVLCLGVAEVVAAALPLEHSYWVTLTVAVTLKPDFGSVFARAVQRGLGTIVGVLIGTVALVFVPYGLPILIVMAAFAVLLPISIRRNYGMFATFLTPLIVLQLDLVNRGDQQLVLSRVTDTAIGCAIVLLVGYLPWPGSWRSRTVIGERIATALDEVTIYLRVAFDADADPRSGAGPTPGPTPRPMSRPAMRSAARRRAYRRLSDVRTALQQALAEPPPTSTRASAWWPAIVALERLTDAITAAATRVALGGQAPPEPAARSVVAAMDELSAALHEGRSPAEPVLPEDPQLAGVVIELQTAWSVLAEPDAQVSGKR